MKVISANFLERENYLGKEDGMGQRAQKN